MNTLADRVGDDPWLAGQGAPEIIEAEVPEQPLRIKTFENVAPLDAQLGVFPKKTVPDVLHDIMFGLPEPTAAEIGMAGGNAAAVPPMQTYAVLDAIKIANLPELLEDSGLEHRCLFKGDAHDELKDVAPWVVRLDQDSSFTRNLFTRSDAPWHLWDCEPGVYIRSRGTLDDMWRHLRKFTRLRDEGGAWLYFRFWQADILLDLLWRDAGRSALARAFPALGQAWQIQAVLGLDKEGDGAALSIPAVTVEASPQPVARQAELPGMIILAATRRRRIRQMAQALRRDFTPEFSKMSTAQLRQKVGHSVQRMERYHFTAIPLLYMLAAWELFYGPLDRIDDPDGTLASDLNAPVAEQAKFLRIRSRLEYLDRAGKLRNNLETSDENRS